MEDLCLFFTVPKSTSNIMGQTQDIELIPGGKNIQVNNSNRLRYIHLMAHYYLNVQIQIQSHAFLTGLKDVLNIKWLRMFNEPELQILISGVPGKLDLTDLATNTRYSGGYFPYSQHVRWLWAILKHGFSPAQQALFLRFVTSCERSPLLGFSMLNPNFCIHRVPIMHDDEKLPSASTCFNTLKLPTYSSQKIMKAKLILSIESKAGFEMS